MGAISDVKGFTCAPKADVWSATFEIQNSTDKDATYRVMTVVTNKSGVVLGSKEINTVVKAKGKQKVSTGSLYTQKKGRQQPLILLQ